MITAQENGLHSTESKLTTLRERKEKKKTFLSRARILVGRAMAAGEFRPGSEKFIRGPIIAPKMTSLRDDFFSTYHEAIPGSRVPLDSAGNGMK